MVQISVIQLWIEPWLTILCVHVSVLLQWPSEHRTDRQTHQNDPYPLTITPPHRIPSLPHPNLHRAHQMCTLCAPPFTHLPAYEKCVLNVAVASFSTSPKSRRTSAAAADVVTTTTRTAFICMFANVFRDVNMRQCSSASSSRTVWHARLHFVGSGWIMVGARR